MSATRPPAGVEPRIVAARVLDAVLHRGRSLKTELAFVLPRLADVRDRALAEAVCLAVLRQPARYEAALAAWMAKPLPRRESELRALLFAGFAQLDPMGLPAYAAVDATVGAARAMGRDHQAGLVNALLRRAQREGLPTVAADAHWPSWLRTRIRRDWPEAATRIYEASAEAPPQWLRVNRLHGDAEAYRARLQAAGIDAQASALCADALRLDVPQPVAALPGFEAGDVSVQDASAQQCADALAPPAGGRVLDACAAPGGKSAHLLERDPSLRLTAIDVDPARLSTVQATFARLGVGADGRCIAADAAQPPAWWDGQPFEAILVDAPCSATGIVRRQPDVLRHRRESDLAALRDTQARLLDALWPTLAPGGALLYATCSILVEENAAQIDAFIARTPDARAEDLGDAFGRVSGAGRQRLPGEDGADGFFYARLRKAS